jgi:small subunit ribosomal protein S16
MLVIRLRRIGRVHDPHYRIVVAEHTAPVQGKFLAEVGHYHPKNKALTIKHDEFLAWLEQGAKPSNTVAKLAERDGLAHAQINVIQYHGKPKKKSATTKKGDVKPEETKVPAVETPEQETTENTPETDEITTSPEPEPEAAETADQDEAVSAS